MKKNREKSKQRYDQRHEPSKSYRTGEKVMIRHHDVTPGINKKLIPTFKSPYEITKVLDHDRYVVQDIESFQLTRTPFSTIVGADQMKYWIRNYGNDT